MMPDSQFPDDDNGDSLRHMAEQGVDLSAHHKVNFEFVFSDEHAARKFAAAVGESPLEVAVQLPVEGDEDEEWEVLCSQRMVPSHEEITATEKRLEVEAVQCGGFADGWGLMSKADGSPAD